MPAAPQSPLVLKSPAPEKTLSVRWRIVISVLLLFHLTAVCVAPWSVEPSSMLSGRVWTGFQPYLEAAFLNHGYHFFAPEPGPSHLVRYELEFADGSREEGVFPNLAVHQPRLFYHRHFMMSEFLNASPPDSPGERAYAQSYADHLLAERGARKVTLYLRRHLIPTPEDVLAGADIRADRYYEERLLGTFTGDGA